MTFFINPLSSTEIAADACGVYPTGIRFLQQGQRYWWVWVPLVGKFNSGCQLLAAMIEVIARGKAVIFPNRDLVSVGGVWYDFDSTTDIVDPKILIGMATDDMQKRVEEMMANGSAHEGQKPAMGFR